MTALIKILSIFLRLLPALLAGLSDSKVVTALSPALKRIGIKNPGRAITIVIFVLTLIAAIYGVQYA